MDEASIHRVMSGTRTDLLARMMRPGLRLASWAYGSAMIARNFAYDWNLLRSHRVDAPVVSIGNITTGGTGKTPLAAWIVQVVQSFGGRPGILSRGYRSLTPSKNGERVDLGNDEKRVLDRLCPGVPHIQRIDRVEAAKELIDAHGCNVVILDDGFQHRRLERDLNLVLIDALRPWG
ncbi:MAG: tetraacyldisaccharide 4'-kinase, partial [Planctomycetes bacterium]|nr:tetraacyldisaccharide 4'-kinase [Planctomycetota bacterium]